MEPWICPRCETVWAGWVAKCTCKPATVVTTSTTSPIKPQAIPGLHAGEIWTGKDFDEPLDVVGTSGGKATTTVKGGAVTSGSVTIRCTCGKSTLACPIHSTRLSQTTDQWPNLIKIGDS